MKFFSLSKVELFRSNGALIELKMYDMQFQVMQRNELIKIFNLPNI